MDVKEQKRRDIYERLCKALGAHVPDTVRMYGGAVELAAVERLADLLSTAPGQELVKALSEGAPVALPDTGAPALTNGAICKQWFNEPPAAEAAAVPAPEQPAFSDATA